jgi:hypothetical protein
METIICNGEYFDYELNSFYSNNLVVYDYTIWGHGLEHIELFQFEVTIASDGTPIVSNMQNNDEPLESGKGLDEFMIQHVGGYVAGRLHSSSNSEIQKKLPNEFRTPSVTKIWEKLVAFGIAIYDEKQDRFIVV